MLVWHWQSWCGNGHTFHTAFFTHDLAPPCDTTYLTNEEGYIKWAGSLSLTVGERRHIAPSSQMRHTVFLGNWTGLGVVIYFFLIAHEDVYRFSDYKEIHHILINFLNGFHKFHTFLKWNTSFYMMRVWQLADESQNVFSGLIIWAL